MYIVISVKQITLLHWKYLLSIYPLCFSDVVVTLYNAIYMKLSNFLLLILNLRLDHFKALEKISKSNFYKSIKIGIQHCPLRDNYVGLIVAIY